jgi:phage baseplate assembly protein V
MTMQGGDGQFGESAETFWGLYPGVAKKVVDPENRGRVTVLLPWISSTYESDFASVAQVYAGDGHGAVWLPEEGDQVVVAFLNGQLARPVVLGSIYSKARKPKVARSDSGDAKVLRTKGGHYLLMEDKQGKRIELVDLTGKNSVVIDSDANSVTLKATANITIDAGGDVTITAKGRVKVTGTMIELN